MKRDVKNLFNYPVRNTQIDIEGRNIHLTIVEEPDCYLDQLSKEDSQGRLYLPYWIYLWESSIGLAQHISQFLSVMSNNSVLEIGCGYGLAGSIACAVGANVVFTDFEYDALQFARHNLRQKYRLHAAYVQMDWSAPCFKNGFDVILGADVIYEEHNWVQIIDLLDSLLAPNGMAIFAEPNRKNADGFFERIRERGFVIEKSTSTFSLDQKTVEVNIFETKRN